MTPVGQEVTGPFVVGTLPIIAAVPLMPEG